MRPLILIAIAALAAAMCGDDSASLDAGPDAMVDAQRDAVSDTPHDDGNDVVGDTVADSRRDAGPALWTRLPGLPDSCELEYSMQPEAVLEELRWAACPSGPADDCSILEYDTGLSTTRENVTLTHASAGSAEPLFELAQASEGEGGLEASVQLVDPRDPRILAAWRFAFSTDSCLRALSATDADHLGFEVQLPGKESLFFRTRLDALPSMPDEPIGRLTEAEQLGAVGTGHADQLHHPRRRAPTRCRLVVLRRRPPDASRRPTQARRARCRAQSVLDR